MNNQRLVHTTVGLTPDGELVADTQPVLAFPLPHALTLLVDLAARALDDPDAAIKNDLAREATPQGAWFLHSRLSMQVVAPLRDMGSAERIAFSLWILDYASTRRRVDGLEFVMASCANAVWFCAPDAYASMYLEKVSALAGTSRLVRKYGMWAYDPYRHLVSWISRDQAVAVNARAEDDPWRKKLREAAAKAGATVPVQVSIDDIRKAVERPSAGGEDPGGVSPGLPGFGAAFKDMVDAAKSLIDQTAVFDGAPTADDYATWAHSDLGPSAEVGFGVGAGGTNSSHESAAARGEDYLHHPEGPRAPLTKADVDQQGFVAGDFDAENKDIVLGTVAVAIGWKIADASATLAALNPVLGGVGIVFGAGLAIYGGFRVLEAQDSKDAKKAAAAKQSVNPDADPIDVTHVSQTAVKKFLAGQEKITPGSVFSPASDKGDTWDPVDENEKLIIGRRYLIVPIDPLRDPADISLVADERPARAGEDVDEDLKKKLRAMILESRVYVLKSGIGPSLAPLNTGKGYVLP